MKKGGDCCTELVWTFIIYRAVGACEMEFTQQAVYAAFKLRFSLALFHDASLDFFFSTA